MKRLIILAFTALVFTSGASAAQQTILHRYSTGQQVKNLQWIEAGHRPSAFRIKAYRGPINGIFNTATVRATINLKYRLGWPTRTYGKNCRLTGPRHKIKGIAGPYFINVLKGKAHRPFCYKLAAGKRLIQYKKLATVTPAAPLKVQVLVADAKYLIANANLVGYTQDPRRMSIVDQKLNLPPLKHYIYEDCSSSITGLYYLARLTDPNGFGYTGAGYTGTLALHGTLVWRLGGSLTVLRPGDLIFYAGGFPFHHVSMYIGGGRVFSHGTNTGPFNLPVLYRSDAIQARRYVMN